MIEAIYDDGCGIRISIREDGGLEIEQYIEECSEYLYIHPQEAMDIATDILAKNTPADLSENRYCEDCRFHLPEHRCKKLLERPERITELFFHQANSRKINRGFSCGYYKPRKDKKK